MSDLLPLVVAALNDKIAAEAQEELVTLRRDLDVSSSVEIIRDAANDDKDEPVVVYASAKFQDGAYSHNPNLWQVDLEQGGSSATCRLADLRECRLCVGGGFPLESLNDEQPNRASYSGFLDPNDADGDNSKAVSFCFSPNSTWLVIVVHGWPREEWEAVIAADDLAPDSCISFLVETVALEHPEATVEFSDVSFVANTVQGALKRLLPPRRMEELRAERDGRETKESRAHTDLVSFVCAMMRNHGDENGSALLIPQLNEVMGIMSQLGIGEKNDDNEELITTLITAYERNGRERLEAVIQQATGGSDE